MLNDPVRIVMRKRKFLTAKPGTPVARAAQRMAARNVGAILVIEDDRLVGIITERDIVFRVVSEGLDTLATRIAEVMTPDPITIDADQPFGFALVVMHREGFRHLPVVEDGQLLGLVSIGDLVKVRLEETAQEAQALRAYIAS